MKKILKYVLWMITAACLLAGAGAVPSRAAGSARISFSDISCQVGETFTVNMTVNPTDTTLAAMDATLLYPTDYLELVSCSVPSPGSYNSTGGTIIISWYDANGSGRLSCSLEFRALKAGATAVTVADQSIADVDGNIISSSAASSAITINAESTASNDATLAALQIAPGRLSPEFSPSRTEYDIQVNNDVAKLAVTARTNDENAKFVVSSTDLQVGDNSITVRVTAEDGSTTQTYTIHVKRMEAATEAETEEETTPEETESESETEEETDEAPEGTISVTVNGQAMLIVSSLEGVTLPEGYEPSDYEYDGQQIQVARGLAGGLIAFYLTDQDGDNPQFYLYHEEDQTFTRMQNIQTGTRMYTVMDLDDGVIIPDSYHETTVEIDGMDIRAWQSNEDMEGIYYLVYAMNWNGERNLYRYDSEEGTMQRADETLLVMQNNAGENGMDDLQAKLDEAESQRGDGEKKTDGLPGWIWYAVIGVLAVIIVVTVILMILKNRKGGGSAGGGSRNLRREGRRRRRDLEEYYAQDEFKPPFESEKGAGSAGEQMKTSDLSNVLSEMENGFEDSEPGQTGKTEKKPGTDDDGFEFFDL